MDTSKTTAALGWAQSALYVSTGLWPIVHLRSFEAVTGPKLEGWLVKTVGGLISVVGGVLGRAAYKRRVTPEVKLLAAGAAAVLGFVDVLYVAKKRISPVYLLDSLTEALLVAGWIATLVVPGRPEALIE